MLSGASAHTIISQRSVYVLMTGSEFRKWRRSQEISQQEVADYVGCNKSTICRWEKSQLVLADVLYEKVLEFVTRKQTEQGI